MRELSISQQVITDVAKECFNQYMLSRTYVYAHETGSFPDLKYSWDTQPKEVQELIKEEVTIYLFNPTLTIEELHQVWLTLKTIQGWTYGDSLSFKDKTFLSVLPFPDLPDYEKDRKTLFVNICLRWLKDRDN